MPPRFSRSRKSRVPGHHKNTRNVSSATGTASSARRNASSTRRNAISARGSESRRPSLITLNTYMDQLKPKLAAIDEKGSTQRKEKRNVARPYFEAYMIIKRTFPILNSGNIDDIVKNYTTNESISIHYYPRLQRIVNTDHEDLESFMEDKTLLRDMNELCDGVAPSWRFTPNPKDSDIAKVKKFQREIPIICKREKRRAKQGGSKSRKRQKRQKKRTKRKYYKKNAFKEYV